MNQTDNCAAPWAFKPLFFAALLLAAALAGGCGWLAVRHQAALDREGVQLQRADLLEQQLADQQALADQRQMELQQRQAELEQRQTELEQLRTELAQAQDAIALLEKRSLAAPSGDVPEYSQLYPDLYVPAWKGEVISGGKVCCLTFDDGPSANTDRVLDILDQYGIKATFFVVGRTGQADQERMKRIAAAGHTIAVHSWSHNYQKIYASVESYLEDFNKIYQWIYEVTGVYPQVFRFPGGSINGYNRKVYQEIIAEMTRRGFAYYDWNVSFGDSTVQPAPVDALTSNGLRGVGRKLVVVLSHDSAAKTTTVDALPAVIQGYRNAGYTFSALHPGVTQVTFGYPAPR